MRVKKIPYIFVLLSSIVLANESKDRELRSLYDSFIDSMKVYEKKELLSDSEAAEVAANLVKIHDIQDQLKRLDKEEKKVSSLKDSGSVESKKLAISAMRTSFLKELSDIHKKIITDYSTASSLFILDVHSLPIHLTSGFAVKKYLISKMSAINEGMSEMRKCFEPAGLMMKSVECLERVLKGCNNYTSSGGIIYASHFDDNLKEVLQDASDPNKDRELFLGEVQNGLPDNEKNLISGTMSSFYDLLRKPTHSICRLASSSGIDFKASRFSFLSANRRDFSDFVKDLEKYENAKEFGSFCIEKRNLLITGSDLSGRFPESKEIQYFKDKSKKCSSFVEAQCEQFQSIGDRFEFTYQTKGCEKRTIVKEDIQKDVENFRLAGLTEAAVQAHMEVEEIFDFCKAAKSVGYSWKFVSPILKGCVKTKG